MTASSLWKILSASSIYYHIRMRHAQTRLTLIIEIDDLIILNCDHDFLEISWDIYADVVVLKKEKLKTTMPYLDLKIHI